MVFLSDRSYKQLVIVINKSILVHSLQKLSHKFFNKNVFFIDFHLFIFSIENLSCATILRENEKLQKHFAFKFSQNLITFPADLSVVNFCFARKFILFPSMKVWHLKWLRVKKLLLSFYLLSSTSSNMMKLFFSN